MWRFYLVGIDSPYGEVRSIPYRWLAVEGIGSWLLDKVSSVRWLDWLNYLGAYSLASWLIWKAEEHETVVTRVELTAEQAEILNQDMWEDYEDE